MRKFFILFFPFLVITTTYSQTQEQSTLEKLRQQAQQTGALTGKIRDEKTGEDLIGASVSVINTKLGASTDIDGRFEIKRVPEGTVDIRVSFIGYETKVVTGISVKMNEQTTLDVSLNEDQGIQQEEVVISATAIKSGEGAILAERKKAASIGDGISAEQMKRSPDATSGDALKRVTGVTVVDNKFVFVRGVTDRYNQTTLNGASVTSTSVDKKSFSFDMLPSNLIENMNIAKTATPDLPGDFTGGLVQLNTLDFPDARTIKLLYSNGFNSFTTFGQFNRSQGGSDDWIGQDDGIREFPEDIPSAAYAEQMGSRLPNTWAPKRNSSAPMNQSFSVSYADIFDIADNHLGFLAALSYRNGFQRTNAVLNEYTGFFLRRNLAGTEDRFSVLWGAIFDVNYKFADVNKITLKNNYNKTAEDKYVYSAGNDYTNAQYVRSYLSEWEERGMMSNQVGGEHKLSDLLDMDVDWLVFFSESNTDQPDRKQADYNLSHGYPDTDPYTINTQFTKRAWGSLYDRSLGERINITVPIENVKFKLGILHEVKNRHYGIQYYQPEFLTLTNYEMLQYGIDSIFAPGNFGPGKFNYAERTDPSDRYSAKQLLVASYLMLDIPFTVFDLRFRFTGGARFEKSAQYVNTNKTQSIYEPITALIDKKDILPSFNFTYIVNDVQNLRLAYSHTLNRPEFREMAGVVQYDYTKFEEIEGNPNLTRAYARNYDIRYEIFPDLGDLFAVSYFYKNISHPIEERRIFLSFTRRTWANASSAKNFGWEIEIRKHLGFIGDYFRYFQIVGNYTRIFSEVPYKEEAGATGFVEGIRQMQGQSPYMYNVSLFFTEPGIGTSVNILYNEYGSRIDAIGQIGNGDFNVFEHRRGTVDFSLTQSLSVLVKGMELKYTVKNLSNQPIVFTHGINEYKKNSIGITHSLQFGFNF